MLQHSTRHRDSVSAVLAACLCSLALGCGSDEAGDAHAAGDAATSGDVDASTEAATEDAFAEGGDAWVDAPPEDAGGNSCPWLPPRDVSAPRFRFSVQLAPGGDRVGTEVLNFAIHEGAVYAGMGFWTGPSFEPGVPLDQGATVLVKRGPNEPWVKDVELPWHLRIDALSEIALTTDSTGTPVTPFPMLLAGATDVRGPGMSQTSVFARQAEGTWSRTVLSDEYMGSNGESEPYVRAFTTHVDSVTGVHHVFAGTGWGAVFRGALASDSTELTWEVERIFSDNAGRLVSFVDIDGVLHLSLGVEPGATTDGGLYRRSDGPTPSWERVATWPVVPDRAGTVRGTTLVDLADGRSVILAGREDLGRIVFFDPGQAYEETVELDYHACLTARWGSYGGGAAITAYNDMVRARLPTLGDVLLIGAWTPAPPSVDPDNGSHVFVRTAAGRYELVDVFDPDHPTPGGSPPELRGTRAIVEAPWSDPEEPTFYFGGFDAGGKAEKSKTAWIYEGVWR